MVAVVDVATALVFTVKVAVVAPAATVTVPLLGTAATAALLLDRDTTAPPAGAGPFRFTLPVEEVPPVTVVGLTASDETRGGITVSEAVRDPMYEAVMMTVVAVATGLVVTVNAAVVPPWGTVTVPGTEATAALLLRDTAAPPAGAGPFRVTVPMEEVAPVTLVGLSPSDAMAGGNTVSEAVCAGPLPYAAEMVTVVEAATGRVVTVKDALVAPSGTVTLAGTEAATLLLESETAAPPAGAAPLNVTVPVELLAPVTLAGFSDSESRVGTVGPSAQNSKKLRDHPLPSPTFVVTMRRNLAVALITSTPLRTGLVFVRVNRVCQVFPSSEIWIE
jgi:hypothetical protein